MLGGIQFLYWSEMEAFKKSVTRIELTIACRRLPAAAAAAAERSVILRKKALTNAPAASNKSINAGRHSASGLPASQSHLLSTLCVMSAIDMRLKSRDIEEESMKEEIVHMATHA
jgi:hypothetical protein